MNHMNPLICILELPMSQSDEDECPKRVRRSKRLKVHTVDSVRESVMVRLSNLSPPLFSNTSFFDFNQDTQRSIRVRFD